MAPLPQPLLEQMQKRSLEGPEPLVSSLRALLTEHASAAKTRLKTLDRLLPGSTGEPLWRAAEQPRPVTCAKLFSAMSGPRF